jgi:hypothetical protein
MSRGDLVIVRTYGAKPRIRRVWEETPEAVYIYTEAIYQQRIENIDLDVPEAVGFHRDAVFIYDPATFPADAEGVPQDVAFWKQLQRYTTPEPPSTTPEQAGDQARKAMAIAVHLDQLFGR